MLAEKTLRKHVTLIHAYSLMSVLQRKIINVLFYEAIKGNNQINAHNSVAVECHIPFSVLSKSVKFNSNNTQYLKEAIDGLASLKIEWNLLKDKVPTDISFLNLRILHGAPTFYQNKTLNFSFHKVMLNLIDNPLIYGTIDMELQSEFESKYGHALYENSTRFVNLQKNKVIHLDMLRKTLGVQPDKYTNMRELTRNVITPAIEEVNDRANFIVKLEAVKSGRKTIGFEMAVKNRKKLELGKADFPSDKNEKIHAEIKEAFNSINETVLESIINNYSEEYILEKIAYTKKYAKKGRSGFYPIPYFISAIKHDYQFKVEDELSVLPDKTVAVDNRDEWKNKLHFLQADLHHWQKFFECIKNGNNEAQISNMKNVIAECQKKIKKHLAESPEEETI